MLIKDQFERYTCVEAIDHPWLKDDETGEIPLTVNEQIRRSETQQMVKKVEYE